MIPDDYADAPSSYEGDEDPTYEDGFGEALYFDEADLGSTASGREKTRRAKMRTSTPKVVASARRAMDRDARRHRVRQARTAARDAARRLWPRIPIVIGPRRLTAAQLRQLYILFISHAGELAAKDSVPPGGDFTLPLFILISSATAALAEQNTSISSEDAKALAGRIMRGLKITKLLVRMNTSVTESADDADDRYAQGWIADDQDPEDFTAHGWSDATDEFDETDYALAEAFSGVDLVQPARRPRSPAESIRCARALRQAARYLLRMERRLKDGRAR